MSSHVPIKKVGTIPQMVITTEKGFIDSSYTVHSVYDYGALCRWLTNMNAFWEELASANLSARILGAEDQARRLREDLGKFSKDLNELRSALVSQRTAVESLASENQEFQRNLQKIAEAGRSFHQAMEGLKGYFSGQMQETLQAMERIQSACAADNQKASSELAKDRATLLESLNKREDEIKAELAQEKKFRNGQMQETLQSMERIQNACSADNQKALSAMESAHTLRGEAAQMLSDARTLAEDMRHLDICHLSFFARLRWLITGKLPQLAQKSL